MYKALNIPRWTVTENTGYEPITTFWEDFWIAYRFGHFAILDTYERVMKEWSGNYKYMTELNLVLNHMIWALYKSDIRSALVFDSLWKKHKNWVYDNMTETELGYFFRVNN
jgi:hypothetical protein